MKQSQINPDGTRPQQLSLWAGSLDHANHTAQPENDLEKKMTDISGRRCLESFARLSRPTSWAKTFSALLIGQMGWSSRRCRLTWKLKGTKYNRTFFQLQVSAHRTDATEFGLLLTPTTKEEVQDLDKFKARMEKYPNGTTMPNLATQVMGLLPTPTAVQREHPDRVEALKQTGADTIYSRANGELRPNSIIDYMDFHGLLPTPQAQDHKPGPNQNQEALGKWARNGKLAKDGMPSQLNPRFVAEMMGFPPDWLELPFQSTETNP
jgi:hypothetical protein